MTSASLCATLHSIDTITEDFIIGSIAAPQGRVLTYIENTLDRVLQAIQLRPHGQPSITLKRIKDVKVSISPITRQVERQVVDRNITYSFPGKNNDEAWRFGMGPNTPSS